MSTQALDDRSLAVLGAGRLGETLIRGLLDAGALQAGRVTVTAAHPERVAKLSNDLGVRGSASNLEATIGADLVLLAVKPQQVASVLAEIGGN